MRVLDQEPETLHIYVVREEVKPSLFPIFLSVFALSILVAIALLPYKQPEVRRIIRVPAVLLPLQTFTTTVQVIPTGIKTYPATTAHGILTLTNGSVLSEELPKGMIFSGKDGVEVITDTTVFVPAGSAAGYGYTTVAAHAFVSGVRGNLQAFNINQVFGTSLFVRNLQTFRGGKEAYSVKVVTQQDKETAQGIGRGILQRRISGLLDSPCKEKIAGNISLTWTCQFVRFSVPSYMKVTGARVFGRSVLVDVVYVERPRIFSTK